MSDKEFYTVAEISAIRGISKQAVYKAFNHRLKPYVVVVDGRKCLKSEALRLLVDQPNNQPKKVDQQVESDKRPSPSMIDFLMKQIEEKDKQIESLQQDIRESRLHIQEQSNKLAELLEQSNQLQQNNQMLIKMLGEGSPENKDTIEVSINEEDNNIINKDDDGEDNKTIEEDNITEKKKGFFSWLFG